MDGGLSRSEPDDRRGEGPGRSLTLALLGLLALLMAWRAPELLAEPRFYAEEGAAYFQHAYRTDFLGGVLFDYRLVGYFNLGTNLATSLAAHAVPLDWAPACTTAIAFLVQLVPFGVILGGRSYLWTSTPKKVLGCSALLLAPLTGSNVWFTSLHLPLWCGLIAFCLLMERTAEASPRAARLGGLALLACFLTGAYPLFLLPAFALKAFLTRARRDVLALALGLLALGVQACVHFGSRAEHDVRRRPMAELALVSTGVDVLASHVIGPVAGLDSAQAVKRHLDPRADGSGELVAVLAVALGLAGVFALGCKGPWRAPENLPVVALFAVSGATAVFAHEFHAGGRYSVLPGLLLASLLVQRVRLDERWKEPRSLLCWALLASSLFFGAAGYRAWPGLSYRPDSPRWSEELARWRVDPSHRVRIWPYREGARWTIQL